METNNNKLAKISLGINAVLIIAVIILFVKSPSGSGDASDSGDSTLVTIPDDGKLTIGFYNSDSLNTKSDFVLAVQNDIEASTKRAEQKMANEQARIEKWQKKWESKGPNLLDREIQQYQQEAAEMQQNAAMFEQNLQMELAMEQEKLMMTLYTRIQNYSKSFSEKNSIDILFSYQIGQNILYCNPNYDVTAGFIAHTNKEFSGGEDVEEDTEDEGEE
jgi:Skp family chaperone for outer membrane proteins